MMQLDILAIGAHPDDIEMTSGGYLALAAEAGRRAGALHLTRGEMGTRGTPEEREVEARKAAEVLGLVDVHFAGLEDGYIHCDKASVETVTGYIRRLRPKLVIAPYPICHHPDHEEAAKIVIRACHFANKAKYACEGEPHGISGLIHARYSYTFEPSFYVDISSTVGKKRRAIECYGSQFQPREGEPETRLSNPNFLDQLMARGHAMGLATAVAHAEAYRSYGALVLADPLDVFTRQAPLGMLTR